MTVLSEMVPFPVRAIWLYLSGLRPLAPAGKGRALPGEELDPRKVSRTLIPSGCECRSREHIGPQERRTKLSGPRLSESVA